MVFVVKSNMNALAESWTNVWQLLCKLRDAALLPCSMVKVEFDNPLSDTIKMLLDRNFVESWTLSKSQDPPFDLERWDAGYENSIDVNNLIWFNSISEIRHLNTTLLFSSEQKRYVRLYLKCLYCLNKTLLCAEWYWLAQVFHLQFLIQDIWILIDLCHS